MTRRRSLPSSLNWSKTVRRERLSVFPQWAVDEFWRNFRILQVLAQHVNVLVVYEMLLVLRLLRLAVTVLDKFVFHFIID